MDRRGVFGHSAYVFIYRNFEYFRGFPQRKVQGKVIFPTVVVVLVPMNALEMLSRI